MEGLGLRILPQAWIVQNVGWFRGKLPRACAQKPLHAAGVAGEFSGQGILGLLERPSLMSSALYHHSTCPRTHDLQNSMK